ncbi:hypothetical protein [Novosphingobium naphthalenivorans]|uniref:hypothetical protein n=1 Tax=Novosphingobium naphthalenivorans TaxID=273168 RepID=UPI000830E4C7|nr:hypothetical protein [Novosphingobium naphthalenivorans]
MDIEPREDHFVIRHSGQIVNQRFPTEDDAWAWADMHIDDQVFDSPNNWSPPIDYEASANG